MDSFTTPNSQSSIPIVANTASSSSLTPTNLNTFICKQEEEEEEEEDEDDHEIKEGGERPTSNTNEEPANLDLTDQYALAFQTPSYNYIWSKIHQDPNPTLSLGQLNLLQPDRTAVEQALQQTGSTNLTRLVSDYFDRSEHTSRLCLLLQQSIEQTRALYSPLHDLFFLSPSSSFSQSQLNWAFDILSEFHAQENPFSIRPDFGDVRLCLSQLKLQLDGCLHRAQARSRLARNSAICLVGTAIGVALSAIIIATHALGALVAAPFFPFLPAGFATQQLRHISQLDAAARGAYVLHNDLDTIDRLVARLHDAVETDRMVVQYGLQRGREPFTIMEVVKLLKKNQPNFEHQLKDLEEHVCLCFATVNRARSLLLQQIFVPNT